MESLCFIFFLCRTAFELIDDKTDAPAKREDDQRRKSQTKDTKQKLPPRSLSPLKQDPSTSAKLSTTSQATQSALSSHDKLARATSEVPKKNGKHSPFLTKAFFNTVAPGLASFAETQKDDLDVVVEEDEEIEEDPDVIAIVADF